MFLHYTGREMREAGGGKETRREKQNYDEEGKTMKINLLLSDIYWVFWRETRKFIQQRARIIMAFVQPVVWLVLMGNMMTGLTNNPDGGQNAWHRKLS